MNKDIEQAIIKAKRTYAKEWREKNKDKVKAAQQRHWEKKAMELLNQEKC